MIILTISCGKRQQLLCSFFDFFFSSPFFPFEELFLNKISNILNTVFNTNQLTDDRPKCHTDNETQDICCIQRTAESNKMVTSAKAEITAFVNFSFILFLKINPSALPRRTVATFCSDRVRSRLPTRL